MQTIANIFILLGAIKILQQTNKPLWPAIIYAFISFIFGIMFGREFFSALIAAGISFMLAYIYFWLLNKTEGSIFWWIILIIGATIGLI